MRLDKFAKQAVTWGQCQPKIVQDKITGENVILATHCNRFVALCANEAGCKDLGAPDEWMANQMINRLEDRCARNLGWREADAYQAQEAANRNLLVIAGCRGDPHGHVCLVVPGEIAWSKKHEKDMPIIANAGKENFYGRLASFAFGPKNAPRYWIWDGPYPPEAEVK